MAEQIGREFFRRTRLALDGPVEPSDQMKELPQPPLEDQPLKGAPLIELPQPDRLDVPALNLAEAINRRRSVRDYSSQPITLAELSWLGWSTQGVKEVVGGRATLRTVPSAGARHAFETYLLANNVEGVPPGLCRYLAVARKLARLPDAADLPSRLVEACCGQAFVASSAVTFLWVADAYRMTWRYGQRGYRYLLLDAGHVCQNLYLAAEAIGCGVCAVGAYDDELVNAAVGLDGENQFVAYIATVGKKA